MHQLKILKIFLLNYLEILVVLDQQLRAAKEDAEYAKKVVSEHIAYYVGGMGTFYNNTVSRYGFGEEAREIAEAWKNGSKSLAVGSVSGRMLDALTIYGAPSEGKAALNAYHEAGSDIPILVFPPKASRALVRETMVSLAPGK